MELIDTHCHIQSLDGGIGERTTRTLWDKVDKLTAEKVIANAAQAGVTRMICVGCDLEDSRLAVDFVKSRENCFASVGIHPHEAQRYFKDQTLDTNTLSKFAKTVLAKKVVAVGECGLDYFYTHSPKAAQIEALKFQLELAQKHNLPVIFHVREAFDDFWTIFDQFAGIRGVLHSFTDSEENMHEAVKRGLCIGVNGIVTFMKDQAQKEIYRTIPLENLLLETDAPFLTPTPYRGTINEPKHIGVIANFVAELRGESLEKIAAATTANARRLFSI